MLDAGNLATAYSGTGVIALSPVPSCAAFVLQGFQVTGTGATVVIGSRPVGPRHPSAAGWATLATLTLSGAGNVNRAVAVRPAGELRIQVLTNNGTVRLDYALHRVRD